MTDETEARLAVIEFFLEQLLGALHAEVPKPTSDYQLGGSLKLFTLANLRRTLDSPNPDHSRAVAALAESIALNLVERVASRAANMRRLKAEVMADLAAGASVN